ncbi:Bug family tripartite tricarboxylate transporter substrate binding protein [Pelagibacterium luteolum]|nr:tripartite tricarboxylate transporter substrate-binding protein [Pelagibacterium luteolum]
MTKTKGQANKSRRAFLASAAAIGLFTAGYGGSAMAQSVEEFYAGNTVTIYVGFGPGGGYDLYARLASEFLGRHIPGNPEVIVENMPGAGGRTAAMYLYSIAAQDGTALSVPVQSIALDSLLNVLPGDLDARNFIAIGRMTPEYELGMVWNTVEADTLEEIMETPVTFASTGAGSASSFVPLMLNDMIGTQFQVIQGYQGANAAMLAIETGEVDAAMQGLAGMTVSKPDWIPEGIVDVVWQLGVTPHQQLPDVPAIGQLGNNDLDKASLRLVASAAEIGRALITTPNVPEDRVAALRTAFDAMVADPEFIAAAETRNHLLDPMTGQELQDEIAAQMDVPQEVIDRVMPYVVAQ